MIFDRSAAIRLSGMSEKVYIRCFNAMQNGIGVNYKERFLAALPASRRANTDFSRPVFTAVAFYLCAKKHKIMNSMSDLCFDVLGSSKEKKDPQAVKGHRELLPKKRMSEDDGDVFDDSSIDIEDDVELPCYKKRKLVEKKEYNEWKSSVISSNQKINKASTKRSRQSQLNFLGKIQQ